MRAPTKVALGILCLLVVVSVVSTITIIHSQQKPDPASSTQRTLDNDVPIADYNASPPEDPEEKRKRKIRGKRHNIKLGPETGVSDPRRFQITEKSQSVYGGFESHSPAQPAIPAAQSDVVVLGEITNARAFLSEDRVSLYSEFAVKVDLILKNSSSTSLGIGDSITIYRGGGALRLPSGKIYRMLLDGMPMPYVGSRYVFFLKYNSDSEDYPLVTAYKLNNGKVIPLDGLKRNGQVVPQLSSHQSYMNMSEADFINLVQEAVFNSKDVFEREAR